MITKAAASPSVHHPPVGVPAGRSGGSGDHRGGAPPLGTPPLGTPPLGTPPLGAPPPPPGRRVSRSLAIAAMLVSLAVVVGPVLALPTPRPRPPLDPDPRADGARNDLQALMIDARALARDHFHLTPGAGVLSGADGALPTAPALALPFAAFDTGTALFTHGCAQAMAAPADAQRCMVDQLPALERLRALWAPDSGADERQVLQLLLCERLGADLAAIAQCLADRIRAQAMAAVAAGPAAPGPRQTPSAAVPTAPLPPAGAAAPPRP